MKVGRNITNPSERASGSITIVIGMGNLLRGDDAAGRLVATRIKERNPPRVSVAECSGEGTELMELWKNADTVIVVDAIASGAAAGAIQRFDANQRTLPIRLFGRSTHDFGLAEAVELARALNRLPRRLIVFGIEGKAFNIGNQLSVEVERIVPEVVDRVLEEICSNSAPYGD